MKVFAGYFMDGDSNENPSTVHVCTSEKELVDKLVDDMDDMDECQTLDELEEKLQEAIDNDELNSYSHISYTITEL